MQDIGYDVAACCDADQWEETNPEQIADIRRLLLKLSDYDLKTIVSRLRRPEVCAPETYTELIRTSSIQGRLLALGLMKKPVNERERRRDEFMRLASRYDRAALYEQVWSQPVQWLQDEETIIDEVE